MVRLKLFECALICPTGIRSRKTRGQRKVYYIQLITCAPICVWYVDSSWNVMAHGDAREGKWRGMEWVASTLHTTSEHSVSSITTADAQTSAASSRLNWRPSRFKWTRPFRRKTKYGLCAYDITFQLASTTNMCCPICLRLRYLVARPI